jgi:hypothetical protein
MASAPRALLLTLLLLASNVFGRLELSEKLWEDERDYAGRRRCEIRSRFQSTKLCLQKTLPNHKLRTSADR